MGHGIYGIGLYRACIASRGKKMLILASEKCTALSVLGGTMRLSELKCLKLYSYHVLCHTTIEYHQCFNLLGCYSTGYISWVGPCVGTMGWIKCVHAGGLSRVG